MSAGRPIKYNETYHPLLVEALAESGYTDKEIADKIGIAKSTLYEWEKKYKEFSDSKKRAKAKPNKEVAKSVYKSAMGFEVEEKKVVIEDMIDASGNSTGIKKRRVEKTTRFIPPNMTAGIFYLKNRDPKQWRDKQEIDLHNADYREQEEKLKKIADSIKKKVNKND